MRTNSVLNRTPNLTHEGAPAYSISPLQELRRTVMACLLWEDTFYESGKSVADRIAELVPKCDPAAVGMLALEARSQMNLRHAPLMIVREMARHSTHRKFVRATLSSVIQRADEMAEFLALYWNGKDKDSPIAASVKKGLADAFGKFNEYQFAKYNRDGMVKLRDVMFLCHPKPTADRAELYKKIAEGTLSTPDTWEVALSAGADKRSTWIRLIEENKLGALAMLRNLRNMQQVNVPDSIIRQGLKQMKVDRVLPFRFIAAARYAPQFVSELDEAMMKNLAEASKLPGRTILLVDVSGSMADQLSSKSEMTRMDAACGLAVLARELCESVRIYSFSSSVVEVPSYRGIALADAVKRSQPNASTYLGRAVSEVNKIPHDRIIVLTDEQSHDRVPGPDHKGYMINIASYKNGVGYGPWLHIDGWSERVLDYMKEIER